MAYVPLQGAAELKKALDEFRKEFGSARARAVQVRVLLKNAKPVVADAERFAPKDTGKLATSIRVQTKRPRGMKTGAARAFAQTLALGGSQAEARGAAKAAGAEPAMVFVGPGQNAWYAHFQEFGTVKQRPHAFIRPALDANAASFFDNVGKDLYAEMEKTAQRVNKRNAKGTGRNSR